MTCTTHHYACDCREAKFAALEAENAKLREALEKIAKNKTEDGEIYTMGCDCDEIANEALKLKE